MQVVLIIYDLRLFFGVLFVHDSTHMLFNQSRQESTTIDFNKSVIFSDSSCLTCVLSVG